MKFQQNTQPKHCKPLRDQQLIDPQPFQLLKQPTPQQESQPNTQHQARIQPLPGNQLPTESQPPIPQFQQGQLKVFAQLRQNKLLTPPIQLRLLTRRLKQAKLQQRQQSQAQRQPLRKLSQIPLI